MEALAWHVTIRLEEDAVILPSVAARRAAARVVLRVARPFPLLAFRFADTHGHLEVLGSRAEASELARRVEIGLHRQVELPSKFAPARVRPIRDQWHLHDAFRYILRQNEHHGISTDPWCDAGNLPDLLGLRPLGVWTVDRVREYLPRVRRAELLTALGVPDLPTLGGDADRLADAAAAATALPDLGGRSKRAVEARRAAVAAASDFLPPARLAAALGVGMTTLRDLRARGAAPPLIRAVAMQWSLRSRRAVSPAEAAPAAR